MSNTNKAKLTNIFTLLVIMFTTFQGLIPALPIPDVTLISAVTLFAVTALTAWKQFVSVEIDDKALYPTLVIAIVATLGGLNDLFGVIKFSEVTGQWIRFSVTFLIAFLNLASKLLWPTEETKSKI